MNFDSFVYLVENYWVFLTAAVLIGVATGWYARPSNH